MQDAATEARYWIPDHLRAAVTATGVVMLDLKSNRYRGLSTKHASELATLATNWSDVSTQDRSLGTLSEENISQRPQAFIDAGLLCKSKPRSMFKTTHVNLDAQLISIGLQSERRAKLRFYHILHFFKACMWSKSVLRTRSLYSIACELSSSKAIATELLDIQRVTELVCIFRRLRPYAFEAKDKCLFHALALQHFLSHYDVFPTWVIGVRPRPWAAHSWLQIDCYVLDANPEDVCNFTPILAV